MSPQQITLSTWQHARGALRNRYLRQGLYDEGTALMSYLQQPGLPVRWQDSEFYRYWQRGETRRVHDINLHTFTGELLPVTLSFSPLTGLQRSMVVIVLDMSIERALHAQLACGLGLAGLCAVVRGVHRDRGVLGQLVCGPQTGLGVGGK